MKEIISTISTKGQITIPAEVRRFLDVKPGDQLVFRFGEDKRVELIPPSMTLEQAFGAVKPLHPPEDDFEQIIAEAHEDHVAEVLKELEIE